MPESGGGEPLGFGPAEETAVNMSKAGIDAQID